MSLSALSPELLTALFGLTFLTASPFLRTRPRLPVRLALLLAGALLLCTVLALPATGELIPGYALSPFSQRCKLLLVAACCGLLAAGRRQSGIPVSQRATCYGLLFLHLSSLMFLISATDLRLLCAAFLLSTLSLSRIVSIRDEADATGLIARTDKSCQHAALLHSGFMLAGLGYLRLFAGTFSIPEVAVALHPSQALALLAFLLVLGGLFWLLAVFPFHGGMPDLCQRMANESAAILLCLPGIAAAAALIRLVHDVPPEAAPFLSNILAVLALASLFCGNLCALVQNDLKRLLGALALVQAGTVLLALAAMTPEGCGVALYATGVWTLACLACLLPLCSLARHGENIHLTDLRGLFQRQPLLATALAAGLIGISGLPPLAGFLIRVLLLTETLNAGQVLLALLIAGNNLLTFAAAFRVLAALWSEPENNGEARSIPTARLSTLALGLALVWVLLLAGLLPTKFMIFVATTAHSLNP